MNIKINLTGGTIMNLCRQLLLPCLFILPLTSASAADLPAKSPRESIPLTTWEFVEDAETNATAVQPPKTAEWKQVAVPHVFRQSGLPDNTAGWYRQTIMLTEADRNRACVSGAGRSRLSERRLRQWPVHRPTQGRVFGVCL